MAAVPEERNPGLAMQRFSALLQSFGQTPLTNSQGKAVETYLSLLMQWNTKMNLTSIKGEQAMLQRHFLESVVCARLLPQGISTLLDYGSGAGFPGMLCAICRPELHVTLAESQTKKAAFLGHVVRTLGVNVAVYHGRVEGMPAKAFFGAVTLRAVDQMRNACVEASSRIDVGGWMAILTSHKKLESLASSIGGIAWRSPQLLPGTEQEVLLLGRKLAQ